MTINNRANCSATKLVALLGIPTSNKYNYDSFITTADYGGNRIEYAKYRSALGNIIVVIEILSIRGRWLSRQLIIGNGSKRTWKRLSWFTFRFVRYAEQK